MKTANILTCMFITTALLTGCKKYEKGPSLSLHSKTARLANTWQVESYTLNGTDYTSILTNVDYTEIYDKDGDYSYTTSAGSESGHWTFQSHKEQIKRFGPSGQFTDMHIVRLKEKEFWYYYFDNSNRHEIHLKKK